MLLFFILLGLNLFIITITVIPYLKLQDWWIRAFDFPRLQSFVLGCLLLLAELFFLDMTQPPSWALISITVLFLLLQGWWIFPYSPLANTEVKAVEQPQHNVGSQQRIRLLCANVLTPNRNSTALLELIQRYRPDILVTLETNQWWQQELAVIESDYPYSLKCPLDNLYGMHVYSKIEFAESRLAFLVEKDVPSMHFLLRLHEHADVRLHVLHPAPPSPTENDTSKARDGELLQVAKYCKRQQEHHDLPVIVAGDLNDVAWSRSTRLFRKISGLLDPRVGRGMFNTFDARYWPVRWPLDHIFHSAHFKLVKMQRLTKIGSDHFPIFIELELQPEVAAEQEGLKANAEDRAWAEEKLSKVDA